MYSPDSIYPSILCQRREFLKDRETKCSVVLGGRSLICHYFPLSSRDQLKKNLLSLSANETD